MQHVLTTEALLSLARWARSDTLLAFDFDGTLAPIMAEPDSVRMRAETAALFGRVCELYPCTVISGRGRRDVASRLAGAPVKYIVGNHGIEEGPEDMPALEQPIAQARMFLSTALAEEHGVAIEDKRFSLSLHYRNCLHPGRAVAAILQAVHALPDGLRAVPGDSVINILPAGARNKGDALLRLKARERVGHALFIGDDVTDEDAFCVHASHRSFSVRVGRSLASAARYFVRDQGEVDNFLAWLVTLRERGRTS